MIFNLTISNADLTPLGAPARRRRPIRAIWGYQGRIALTLDEEKANELRRDVVAGQEQVIWNRTFTHPPRSLSSRREGTRSRRAIETWNGYGVATTAGG
jgi:hypothetical protein